MAGDFRARRDGLGLGKCADAFAHNDVGPMSSTC
jgi:hypothetical protein